MRFLIGILIFICHIQIYAQSAFDSIAFDNNFTFNNGIYTSLQELKYNSPSYLDCELELDKNQQSVNFDKLYYINSRHTRLKYESALYAIVVDGHLSIFYKDQFNSVFLKGAISTFILKEVVTTTTYQPMNNMAYGYPGYGGGASVPVTSSHLEVNIYFLDFMTGVIAKVDKDNLDPIIKRDAALYESFNKIKGDSNNKKSYPFISQFNTRNPFYILVQPAKNAETDQ
jgi:hypothetical protein